MKVMPVAAFLTSVSWYLGESGLSEMRRNPRVLRTLRIWSAPV